MADPKKPLGLLAVLGGKPKAGPAEPAPEMGDSPRRLAAQGVMDALNDGDVAALEDALATFLDAGSSPAPEVA